MVTESIPFPYDSNNQPKIKQRIINWLDTIEELALDFATRLGPWLAPIGPAYFIGRAVNTHLHAHLSIAVIMACAVELVGIAATHTALRAWTWNQMKRKTDPDAPFTLMVWLSLVYFFSAFALSILVEVFQQLATYAPAVFLGLAAVAYVTIGVATKLHRWEGARQKETEARQIKGKLAAEVERLIQSVRTLSSELDNLTLEVEAKQQTKAILDQQLDQLQASKAVDQGSQKTGQLYGQNEGGSPVFDQFSPDNLPAANEAIQAKILRRRKILSQLIEQNGQLTNQEIADQLGVSVGTVKNDKRALNGQRQV
ncbi:MAG: HTH domain-containing protein [Chloroflexota bacterium]